MMSHSPAIDAVVVGAGFAGAVCARRLADAGKKVLVIDKRHHIGGNAYDVYDSNGVIVHPYGPHIFHTNSLRIIRWLSQFTGWRFYEHRVLAKVDNQLVPIPINRTTLSLLYGHEMTENDALEWLERVRLPRERLLTSEDVVLNSVGEDLCNKFFRGYTQKQWGLDLSQLSAGVAARIPTRTTDDDRYFTDTYQLMPVEGYSSLFERILNHTNIRVELNVDFFATRRELESTHIVYTGPIDAYFDYCFGKLPYRSLRFEHVHITHKENYQSVGTVNFPNEHAYTRVTEFKHLTGQHCKGTSIVFEYPQAEGDPYYPIPRLENHALYERYKQLAEAQKGVTFVGRLAQYKYYNMDQVVGAALAAPLPL